MSPQAATNAAANPAKLETMETISANSSSELEMAEMGEVKANHVVHKRGLKPFIVLAAVCAALGTHRFLYDCTNSEDGISH